MQDIFDIEQKWFQTIATQRIIDPQSVINIPAPVFDTDEFSYTRFIRSQELSHAERLLLALAMMPHLRPDILNELFMNRVGNNNRVLWEIGGITGKNYNGFLPTGLTFIYMIAGNHTAGRRSAMIDLVKNNSLIKKGIIRLAGEQEGEPLLSGMIVLDEAFAKAFILNEDIPQRSNRRFELEKELNENE